MLYFDHNSTTPLDSRVADVLDHANRQLFGNASSVHIAGQTARQKLEQSRRIIALCIGAHESELIITSGGTESNNVGIQGVLKPGHHAITTVVEHPSVLEPFRKLEKTGVNVTYLKVNPQGLIDLGDLDRALRPDTALVSVMLANNETGVIQPVTEIARLLERHRQAGGYALFHCDAVQAAGKLPLNLHALGVDLVSVSGHKLYAPKGIGILYIRKGVKIEPLHLGGRHERGHRGGTENVPGAVALAHAFELCSQQEADWLRELRDTFERKLLAVMPEVRVNAADAPRLPNTSNILFPEISGQALLIALDMHGMCVSAGSACSSGSIEPSPVLLAMGLSNRQARGCIRFSFGRGNTLQDVNELVVQLSSAVYRMREKQLV